MIHVKDHKQRDMFNPFCSSRHETPCPSGIIMGTSDTASYVSARTLWNLRDIVAQHGLQDALFEKNNQCSEKTVYS